MNTHYKYEIFCRQLLAIFFVVPLVPIHLNDEILTGLKKENS